jgi:hypothetical protein
MTEDFIAEYGGAPKLPADAKATVEASSSEN